MPHIIIPSRFPFDASEGFGFINLKDCPLSPSHHSCCFRLFHFSLCFLLSLPVACELFFSSSSFPHNLLMAEEAAMFRAYSRESSRMPSHILKVVGEEVAKSLAAPSTTSSHNTAEDPSESSTPLLLSAAPPETGPTTLEPIEEEQAPSPPPNKCLCLQRKRKRVAPLVQSSPLPPLGETSSKAPKVQAQTTRVPTQESPRVAEVPTPTPVWVLALEQTGPSTGDQPGISATPSTLPAAPSPSAARTRAWSQRSEYDFTASLRLPFVAGLDPVGASTEASGIPVHGRIQLHDALATFWRSANEQFWGGS
ncbi:verprolin-like [Zingiber officinale]|uniref:verprolin-like n=1 Tax=Zingiber officinale TaxID=94328 RepID=UPI001C4B1772|nr:verprolin-like [Zingiber officinale]